MTLVLTSAHSMACFKPETQIPYKAMILIEPPMSDRQLREEFAEDRRQHMAFLAKSVGSQRSEFESREAAYEWMCKRNPWKVWDDRVKRLFVVSHPVGPVKDQTSNRSHYCSHMTLTEVRPPTGRSRQSSWSCHHEVQQGA